MSWSGTPRVAMLTDNYPALGGVGGIGSYTLTVAEELARMGVDIHVFSMASGNRVRLDVVNGVSVWRCPAWSRRREMPPRAAWTFTRRLSGRAVMLDRFSLAQAVRRACRSGRFDVLESPEFGALGELCAGWSSDVLAVRLHGPATKVLPPNRHPWTVATSPERQLATSADVLTVGSRYAKHAVAEHWATPLDQAVVVENPITARPAAPREAAEQDHAVCVGRLDRLKGYDVLLHATALLKRRGRRVHVTFVGNDTTHEGGGTVSQEIYRIASRLGIGEQVTVLPPARGDALVDLVQRHALCVLPSLVETAPVAVMEAMAWGVPVVTSDIPPFAEVNEGGELFGMAAASDASSLAAAMDHVLANRELALRRASQAQVHAQRWAPERVVPRLLSLWCSHAETRDRTA